MSRSPAPLDAFGIRRLLGEVSGELAAAGRRRTIIIVAAYFSRHGLRETTADVDPRDGGLQRRVQALEGVEEDPYLAGYIRQIAEAGLQAG